MFTKTSVDNEILILVAKQFIEFNSRNTKARQLFIELFEHLKSNLKYIDDQPENIGWHQDRYVDYNTSEVLEFICPLVEEF